MTMIPLLPLACRSALRSPRRAPLVMSSLALVGVLGCTVGPDYRTPAVQVPPQWSQPANLPTAYTAPLERWWTLFDDPQLTALLERAVQSNLDVRIARARLCEARARHAVATADLWPRADLDGTYQYLRKSANRKPADATDGFGRRLRDNVVTDTGKELADGTFDAQDAAADILGDTLADTLKRRHTGTSSMLPRSLFELGFDASWELDVFGGLRREAEAAAAEVDAAEEELHDVVLSLLFEVARNYVEALGYQRRIAVADQSAEAQVALVRLTRARYEGGVAGELEVAQVEAQLASTRAQRQVLDTLFRQTVHRLSLLLGEFPDATLSEFAPSRAPLAAPLEVPLGLPSDLLRRRPDIRRSERRLAAATARIGAATADLFPRFSLTGSFGTAAHDIRHTLDRRSFAWSVGPAVSWPILEWSRVLANVHAQEAVEQQALATYEQTVLAALVEVEDALVALQSERARHTHLEAAVEANARAVRLATAQYEAGVSDFLVVLDSERALRRAEDEAIQSRTSVALDTLAAFKALGGGWSVYATPHRATE